MSDPRFDQPATIIPLDRETLIARFDGIRQFRQGGRRAPNKPLLLLYALARLKHDRRAEIRFQATETPLQPLLRVYPPWGASARVSYPYSRLVTDRLWQPTDAADLFDARGNIREWVARQRGTPAGFAPDVLATFEREPELIDIAAGHLLERHFAPGLHEEILEAVGLWRSCSAGMSCRIVTGALRVGRTADGEHGRNRRHHRRAVRQAATAPKKFAGTLTTAAVRFAATRQTATGSCTLRAQARGRT